MLIRNIFLVFFNLILANNVVFSQEETKNPTVETLLDSANFYLANADFQNSLKCSKAALKISIASNNNYYIARSYNRIAGNFIELSENNKAKEYLNKALLYAEKAKKTKMIGLIHNNIGGFYTFEEKNNDKGLFHLKKALSYANLLNDTVSKTNPSINIAWLLFSDNKFDQGLPYLDFVSNLPAKYNDPSNNASIQMLYGMYYSGKNQNDKAERYFQKGLSDSKNFNLKDDVQDLHEQYSKFNFKIGNHKRAYEHLLIYNKINKDFFEESKLKKAEVEGINLELDEFKREVSKIENEKKLQFKKLKSSKIINYLSFAIAGILGLLLFVTYRNIKLKVKNNKKLSESNIQLSKAKEIAEEASKAKSQFVSTITHELRTPLYGVIGMTDILQDEYKELQDNPNLKSLKFSAQYLLSLVNDILKISKLEERAVELEYNPIDLENEVESILNSLSFLVKKNNNTTSFKIDKSIPKVLFGDKLRLTQILINLTGNALKFTQNGKIEIDITLIKIENKLHYLEFRIQDNGNGIAKEDQEKIFEKFVQVSRDDSNYQGTGLGLSIVKKLLSSFKSDIKLESELGVGTTFSFIIALDDNLEKVLQNDKNKNIDLPNKENYKFLVVEDNKINQVVTKKIIEKNLGTCILANDGFEAIKIVANQNFDIILMDLNMPGIDGYETTIKIRESGNQTPIIALTASSKDQIRDKVMASGMNEIIVKPFDPIVLNQTIKIILKK